jgi:hypothetical protein
MDDAAPTPRPWHEALAALRHRVADRLDNLLCHLLGRVEVGHLTAQGHQFLVDRPGGGRRVVHQRCSCLVHTVAARQWRSHHTSARDGEQPWRRLAHRR